MNIKHAFGMAAVVWAGLGSSPVVQRAAFAQELAPRKQSLAIPIAATGDRSLECVVPFGPTMAISAVAFSPDGKTLAVGGYQEVLLWDLAAGKFSKRLGVGELSGPVRAVAFGKDGRLAVGEGTPHASGSVKIYNVETGKAELSFEEPTDVVHSLAFSPDGKLLAASGAYKPVHVWSIDEKKLIKTIEEHRGWVLGVSFSADGKLLATAGADNALRVWKVEGWESVAKFVHKEAVRGGVFLADGKTLLLGVGGRSERGIRLRRTDNIRYVRPYSTTVGIPLDLFYVAQGNRLYVAGSDHTVKAMDGGNGRLLATFSGHTDWVHGVAVSADGAKVASASADGTVKLWNAADGKLLATLAQLSPRTEDWLIVTAQGYLATSSADALTWKAENVKTPVEQITGILQKPEFVQKAIAGEKTDPPAIE